MTVKDNSKDKTKEMKTKRKKKKSCPKKTKLFDYFKKSITRINRSIR